MEDYNKVLEATSVAENANGVAAEKMTVYNESLEAAQNRLTASVQQFAQDSNLDRTLALAYDGLSKVVEILNILLNKIPVLSPLIKALGVTLAAAFAGNVIKNITKSKGAIGELIKAFTNVKSVTQATVGVIPALKAVFAGLTGVISGTTTATAAFGAVMTALGGPVGVAITAIGTLIALLPTAIKLYNNFKNAKENALKQSSQELDEANQNLEETNGQIKDIQDKINEINSKDSMTLTDQAEKERLEEELETLKQIKQVQEDIAASKKSETLQDTKDVIREKYSEDEYGFDYYGALTSAPQTGDYQKDTYEAQTANIGELIANIKYLDEAKKNLTATDEDYQAKLTQVNQLEQENTKQLLSKKQELLEYKQQLVELGDTSSEEYQLVNDRINDITIALDPSKFPKIDLGEMIQTEGMENKIKMVVQSGSEAGKKVAEGYSNQLAQTIHDNPVSLEAWKEALNIPDGQKLGVDQLTQEILALFQEMYGGISEASETASQGFTDQHTALDAYQEAVQNVHDSTTDLTAAYQDMISKGYISESVVKKLTAAHPELTKELKLENGQYKINLQTLKDVYTAEVNKSIASLEAEKKQTQGTIKSIEQRILAYQHEAEILAQSSDDPSARAKMIGIQHSIDMANNQLERLKEDSAGVDEYIADLKQNAANWSPTKTSGSKSSGTSDADKAAKEFEDSIKDKVKNLKSIVELYSENANWDDPTVIKEFQGRYDKLLKEVIDDPKAREVLADMFNLDIKDMPVEQQIQELTTLWQKQAGTIQESYQKLLKNLAKEDLSSAKAVIEKYKDGIYGAWSSDEALNAAKADYQKFIDKITNDADYRAAMAEALNLGDISGEPVEKQIEAVTSALLKSTGTLEDAQQELTKTYIENKEKEIKAIRDAEEAEKNRYDNAIKAIEDLEDITEEMIEKSIDLIDKAGSFVFDLLGKISDKYDKQTDNLDKISDKLDEQKDAFEDKIDKQKELLKLQKQEADNADELADKNKAIADIDAQLMELQYDDSAEAQAKRLKLLDERAEKEKDLADWQKDNDYDAKIDALDKEKSEYEKTIEVEKKALEAQKETIEESQKSFEKTLSVIQNGFNGIIKILSSDTVKNLLTKALISYGGEDFENMLKQYNRIFGDGLDATVDNYLSKYKSAMSEFNFQPGQWLGDIKNWLKGKSNTQQNIIDSLDNASDAMSTLKDNLEAGAIDAKEAFNKVVDINKLKETLGNAKNAYGDFTSFVEKNASQIGKSMQGIGEEFAKVGSQLYSKASELIPQLATIAQKAVGTVGNSITQIAAKFGLTNLGGTATTAAAGTGTAGAGTAGTAAVATGGAGALGTLAIGGSVALGGYALIKRYKEYAKVWSDKDKSFGEKLSGTANALWEYGINPINIIKNAGKDIAGLLGKHHVGADYVKKQNPELDRILGLRDDETVSILKVGEAVVPTWANNASVNSSNNSYTGSPFGSAVDSAVKSAKASSKSFYSSGDSSINISIPISIQGDADASTVKALQKETNNIVNKVLKTINNQTKIGGYKNIKAATV
uniref:Chromosome segregation ATPase n=1 Tax=Siphoviridae sp. ctyvQ1 TaxID=2826525 RepID=A0A8S5R0M9_9CAUD|nr:MAG TPA: chromosome segregation ATPase [Siphoviridae sp. ctyvQ1]